MIRSLVIARAGHRMVAPFIGGALPFFLDASEPARAPPWDVASGFSARFPLCAR
jgi:hypothetical protein